MVVGAVIGRDSQILDLVVPTADEADLLAKSGTEQVVPLVHQVNGRRDHQGATLHSFDCHLADVALARASGQDHNTTPARVLPRSQGLGLERMRRLGQATGEFEGRVGRGGIVILYPSLFELFDNGAVVMGLRPPPVHPPVPAKAGRRAKPLRRVMQH